MSLNPARPLALVATLAVALLAGCSSPIKGVVRSAPAAAVQAQAAASTPSRCRFQVAEVEDLRDEKHLGHMGPRLVDGQDFPDWFRDALARIPGHSTEAAPVQLHVQVLKAYVQGISTMKSANLVVRARIDAPDHAPVSRNYRGVDDSVNWVNGEGEMQDAFDRALEDLTQQLQADLARACPAS